MRFRPTAFGLVLAGAVCAALLVLTASDPQVAGLAWLAVVIVLLVGLLWPVASVAGLRCEARLDATDLEVGESCRLTLAVRGGLPPVQLTVRCWDGPKLAHDGAREAQLTLVATRRGVVRSLEIEAASTAPFGVALARRVLRCELPRPVHVGPRPVAASAQAGAVTDTGPRAVTRGASRRGDEVRSVRPYHPGDPSHLVHWPSTARAGELMIRELEPPTELGIALVLDLPGQPENAGATAAAPDEAVELAVSRAAGRALAVMGAGGLVVLCTCGPDGPITREVGSRLDLSRRLAAAVPGASGTPPEGWPVEVIRP